LTFSKQHHNRKEHYFFGVSMRIVVNAMCRKFLFFRAIAITQQKIHDVFFMYKHRTKPMYFTRKRKMGFVDLISFTLNLVKKSLQLELDLFFENFKDEVVIISKQSFSEARQKISHDAFAELYTQIVEWFYHETPFKTFRGYRLSAVDGSILELNNSKKLQSTFGGEKNDHGLVARALASGLYDLENQFMIAAGIFPCKYGERKAAYELIDELIRLGVKNDLLLFDRGYPATHLISKMEVAGIKYLMRSSTAFLKAVKNVEGPEQIIETRDENQKLIQIRVVKFRLASGEEETLITNLSANEFDVQGLKELYFKRWGIETKYDELKNRLQLENFTGDTPLVVKQDFFASMYLANMSSLAKMDAEACTKKNPKRKYDYKINMNILIGLLKDRFVMMLLEPSPWIRSRI
jgi:hypothetical protein